MGKQFNVDDLVWAKMKGYPPWPGKVVCPPPKKISKARSNCHYIYFFGTENYAWVQDDCIQLHSEKLLEKYSKRKGEVFLKAVKCIVKLSNENNGDVTTIDEDPPKTHESKKNDDDKSKSSSSSNKPEEKSKPPLMAEGFSQSHFMDPLDLQCDETNDILILSSDAPLVDSRNLICQSPPPPLKYIERPSTPPFDFKKSAYVQNKKIIPIKKVVGFLGFSKTAQGIIKNLCHSGHSIMLWHKLPSECKKFAQKLKIKIASTPTDLVKAASIIFCCASEAEFSKDILDSILKGLELSKEKKGYIEMTPMETNVHQMIASEIRLKGAQYLEAIPCGSRSNANEGTLFITAAGDETLYNECKSCFDAISKHHMFVSPEEGTASKYTHIFNMLLGTLTASLAESISVVNNFGCKEPFAEVLNDSGLNNSNLMKIASAMAEKNYETDIPLKDIKQSFTSGLALGHEKFQQTGVIAMANEMFKRSVARGYGDHDVSAVFEAIEP